MSVVAWIVLGLAAGAVATLVLPGASAQRGWLANLVVSELGALIGSFLAAVVLGIDITLLDFTSVLVAGLLGFHRLDVARRLRLQRPALFQGHGFDRKSRGERI